jgi:predicted flap endonuclease-1-like 5' DNA nuclease
MMDMIEANWLAFALALLIGLLVAWWLFARASTPAVRHHAPDVLDDGAAPAKRNQALIDAPPAAQIDPPPFAGTMAGVGEAVAIGAQDVVEEAQARIEAHAPVAAPPPPAPRPEIVPAPEPATPPPPAPEIEPSPEPIPVFEPAPEPGPAPEPLPEAPSAVATGALDDLSRIKGLGPKLQTLLPQLGITTYAQIAGLSDTDLADLDGKLGAFAGRPSRDGWVEQAGYLASGDVAGFEARFGKV